MIVIITGMSGAGKSTALKVLEDFGFHTIDNIPFELLEEFITILKARKHQKFALCVDIREKAFVKKFPVMLSELSESSIEYKTIFLDASYEELLRRYSEARRKHPIGSPLEVAIKKEKKLLEFAKSIADVIIDTSNMNIWELKNKISDILKIPASKKMVVEIISFGYKYGVPENIDMLFDVRCLPNPNYEKKLKHLNGKNKRVKDFIFSKRQSNVFVNKIFELLKISIPLYISEGKAYLVIGFGCTGGKHRSVAISEVIFSKLKEKFEKLKIKLLHRDIYKI